MIGAAVELYEATGIPSYLANAHVFARFMVANEIISTPLGNVLYDGSNAGCNGDCAEFKAPAYRYLLRLYHQTAGNFLRTFFPTLARDVLALGYVLLRERSSFAAYTWLWRHRADVLRRRRLIQARRTRPAAELDRWFHSPGEPL
jgi:hypothetical protein